METDITRLSLLSPLYFVPGQLNEPFNYREGSGEKLFCFDLDEEQYLLFEPDKEKLLGKISFSGETPPELPMGKYLFAQKREILSRKAIIDLAAEIQQEALWQRFLPAKKLYLRYLYEDSQCVTQLFRPYNEN